MRFKRVLAGLLVLAAAAAGAGFWLTAPRRLPDSAFPQGHQADLANGERLFWAGGCASCHVSQGQEDRTRLGGGLELKTPFGVFRAPNISPHPENGIGNWTERQFADAMLRGVSPDGRHYYPAFPYTSYQRMPVSDVLDVFAYLKTLPADENQPAGHDLPFPYSVRRGLGLWKLANLNGETFHPDPTKDAAWNRGAYLVTGPGHCGECHTPRDAFGGLERAHALTGGPAPEGEGRIPDITPTGIGSWTAGDIIQALETGFTPDFDSLGGSMTDVVRNMAKLPAADREAIATYLKSLPTR